MRTGTRVSPSWPGLGPEAGYVEADRSRRTRRNHLQRGGPIGYPRASCLVRSRAPDACGKPLPVKIFSDRHVKSRAAPVAFKIVFGRVSFVGPEARPKHPSYSCGFCRKKGPLPTRDEAAPEISLGFMSSSHCRTLWVPAYLCLTAPLYEPSIALRALLALNDLLLRQWGHTSQRHWPEPR